MLTPAQLADLWDEACRCADSAHMYDLKALRSKDTSSVGKLILSYADSPVSIYLVHGGEVAEKFDPDFVLGGNGMAYDWIPRDEIWIDASYDAAQRKYIIFHELVEWTLMYYYGWDYERAHDLANSDERKHRIELQSESRMSSKAKKLIEQVIDESPPSWKAKPTWPDAMGKMSRKTHPITKSLQRAVELTASLKSELTGGLSSILDTSTVDSGNNWNQLVQDISAIHRFLAFALESWLNDPTAKL